MRVLLLDNPIRVQDEFVGKNAIGGPYAKFTIADCGGSKAVMFIKCAEVSDHESPLFTRLKKDVEIVFWGGYIVENNGLFFLLFTCYF